MTYKSNSPFHLEIENPDYTHEGEVWKFFGLAVGMAHYMEEALKVNLVRLWQVQYQKNIEETETFVKLLDGKTLGGIIRELKKHVDMHKSINDELEFLLDERNKLAHGFWSNRCFSLFFHEDKILIIDELKDISQRFSNMASWLMKMVEDIFGKRKISNHEIISSAISYRNAMRSGEIEGNLKYYLNKNYVLGSIIIEPSLKFFQSSSKFKLLYGTVMSSPGVRPPI